MARASRELVVIGVTGTNGKTTCTQLLAQTLDRCAVIGTLGYGFTGALDASLHTTPDALRVHRLLDDFRVRGAQHAAMEVSSHALTQGRVTAVRFKAAVFTNLTRDHLDYHGDMEAYGAAKAGLFDMPGLEVAVINRDDGFGRDLAERLHGRQRVVTYGFEGADVRALDVTPSSTGLSLRVATPAGEVTLHSPLFGRFNAYNLLAVLTVLLVLGMDIKIAAARLAQARPAAGRVERFSGRPGQPLVVVDYAHTPDALEKVLQALREHTRGKIVCVFGCGGDRDPGKRPEMGAIAERLADTVMVTDDNPRHEAPEKIIGDIIAGMRAAARDPRPARPRSRRRLKWRGADDIVLVAGKGHEDYQQIGDARKLPYCDLEKPCRNWPACVGEAAMMSLRSLLADELQATHHGRGRGIHRCLERHAYARQGRSVRRAHWARDSDGHSFLSGAIAAGAAGACGDVGTQVEISAGDAAAVCRNPKHAPRAWRQLRRVLAQSSPYRWWRSRAATEKPRSRRCSRRFFASMWPGGKARDPGHARQSQQRHRCTADAVAVARPRTPTR